MAYVWKVCSRLFQLWDPFVFLSGFVCNENELPLNHKDQCREGTSIGANVIVGSRFFWQIFVCYRYSYFLTTSLGSLVLVITFHVLLLHQKNFLQSVLKITKNCPKSSPKSGTKSETQNQTSKPNLKRLKSTKIRKKKDAKEKKTQKKKRREMTFSSRK